MEMKEWEARGEAPREKGLHYIQRAAAQLARTKLVFQEV